LIMVVISLPQNTLREPSSTSSALCADWRADAPPAALGKLQSRVSDFLFAPTIHPLPYHRRPALPLLSAPRAKMAAR
jgi:hypothetical protein